MTFKKITEVQWLIAVSILTVTILLAVTLWQGTQRISASNASVVNVNADTSIAEPIQPIPLHIELDAQKVALGRELFHETQLSQNNTVACASCHDLSKGGMDGKQFAVGIDGQVGSINTPTVYNSGFNFRQFWNGRTESLTAQVPGPIHNPIEMGSDWDAIVEKLRASSHYVSTFASLYPDGITSDNIIDAIVTFERSLYTPNSRFDQYLRGDNSAITEAEKAGYVLFKTYGCSSCHQGVNVGGNMYQRMGIVRDYFAERGNVMDADLGRFTITGNEQDRYVFKVPSLRMVAYTAPYFHDGSAPTLNAAVETMAYYQLGRSISDEQVNLLVLFLKTLPGENAELDVKNLRP
jgi:cytochrome c peroxidase